MNMPTTTSASATKRICNMHPSIAISHSYATSVLVHILGFYILRALFGLYSLSLMSILKRSSWKFKVVIGFTIACFGVVLYSFMPVPLRSQVAPNLPVDSALGAPCHLIESGGSIPSGFGAPYNVFSSTRELLLKSYCTNRGFISRFGYDSAGTVAIYRTGYRWDGTRWKSMSYSSDGGMKSGDYIVGKAKTSSQRYATTTATTFIAFTCTYVNNGWKCGCRDNSCNTPYWQIQHLENIFAWNVAVTTSLSSVEKGKGFNVTYTNNGKQPIANCPAKVWLEYLSGSTWRKFTLRATGVTTTSCLSNSLPAGSRWTVSFVLPSTATAGTWRAAYGIDSSNISYSPNFTVTSNSCTSNCEPPPPNNPPAR